MPTLHDVLGKGYFPRELPPPFSTTSFAKAVVEANDLVGSFKNNVKNEHAPSMCVHNMVRSGGLRRNLGIPNPVAHTKLAHWIIGHWADLSSIITMSPFSLSKPVDTRPERAIASEHSLDERTTRRLLLLTSSMPLPNQQSSSAINGFSATRELIADGSRPHPLGTQ